MPKGKSARGERGVWNFTENCKPPEYSLISLALRHNINFTIKFAEGYWDTFCGKWYISPGYTQIIKEGYQVIAWHLAGLPRAKEIWKKQQSKINQISPHKKEYHGYYSFQRN